MHGCEGERYIWVVCGVSVGVESASETLIYQNSTAISAAAPALSTSVRSLQREWPLYFYSRDERKRLDSGRMVEIVCHYLPYAWIPAVNTVVCLANEASRPATPCLMATWIVNGMKVKAANAIHHRHGEHWPRIRTVGSPLLPMMVVV